jgi:hypothetical protein
MRHAGKIMRTKTKNDADKNDRMSLQSKREVFQAGYCSAATTVDRRTRARMSGVGPPGAFAIVNHGRCPRSFLML